MGGAGISCSEERCRVPSRREAIWRKLASSSRARRAASWTLASINEPEHDTRTRRDHTQERDGGERVIDRLDRSMSSVSTGVKVRCLGCRMINIGCESGSRPRERHFSATFTFTLVCHLGKTHSHYSAPHERGATRVTRRISDSLSLSPDQGTKASVVVIRPDWPPPTCT